MSKRSEYRKEAEALRDAARITEDEITRVTLLKMAEEFDRMAIDPVVNFPKELPRYVK